MNDKHRQAVEKMYIDTCCVIEYQEFIKPNKSTGNQEVTVLNNKPCRLSFSTVKSAVQTNTGAALAQSVTLFISPEFNILPGSKIVIKRGKKIYEYKSSGVPAAYDSHQEIPLELFKGWA